MKRMRIGLAFLGVAAALSWNTGLTAAEDAADEWCAAMDLYQEARYSEARAALRRLDSGAADVELDFHLGRLALWFDDEAEARLRLERALAASPHEARLHNAWGDACGLVAQQAALWQKPVWARRCLAAYRRAVELEPANPKWRWSLIGFGCVAPRIVGGGFDRAREAAAELARLDPWEGTVAEATILVAENRVPQAFACLEGVLHDRPEDAAAWYQVGRCAALSGEQIPRGIVALQRCLELGLVGGDGRPTRAAAHLRLAELLERSGDMAGARRERETAGRLQPDLRLDKVALRL